MARTFAAALVILIIGGALGSRALAQNDQQNQAWCAYFTGGPTNCSFATFDDCLQAIKGKTALCVQNTQYAAPTGSDTSTGNRRRHHSAQQ